MGLYRDETGRVIEIDDRFADARGYTPITPAEEGELLSQKAEQQIGAERGIVGDINAAATGLASGLTMGGSDWLLGKTLTPEQRRRVLAEIEAHPTLRAGGELVGTLVGTMDGMGGTPTGYLSNLAAQGVERGLARGGIRGTATALGTMGAEAAAQTAGMYIGHAALEDKDVTAEGLTGALGTGFAFGTGAGGAALGVIKGTVAARRMFSRVMQGEKIAKDAESAWSLASQEALEADRVTAQAAEIKLENIRKAKMEALRGRNEAKAAAAEAKLNAQGAKKVPGEPDFEMGIKTDVRHSTAFDPNGTPTNTFQAPDFEGNVKTDVRHGLTPEIGGTPTNVFQKPGELEGPLPLDEGIAGANGGQVTSVRRAPGEGPEPLIDVGAQPQGEATSVFKPKMPEPAPPAAPKLEGGVEVTRDGRTLMHNGAAIDNAQAEALARAQLPEGFGLGELNPRTPFRIKPGVPAHADIKPNSLYLVKPSELSKHGIAGNVLKEGGVASITKAWGEGKKLPPIDINVTPSGKLYIEDGNHRLMAAVDGDRPLVVNFRKVGDDFKPQAGAKPLELTTSTSLESQLAGTKAKLDEGVALKDIKDPSMPEVGQIGRGTRKPASLIDEWLTEKATHDAANGIRSDADEWLSTNRVGDPLSEVKKIEDIKGGQALRMRREETLREIRYKATEDLLGPQMAKEEQRLAEVMDEYTAARKDLEDHLMQFDDGLVIPKDLEIGIDRKAADAFEDEVGITPRDTAGFPPTAADKTVKGARGERRAIEILDDAHEEALLRARHAADPADAGRAIQEADELEQMLEQLSEPHVQNAKGRAGGERSAAYLDSLAEGVKKVERYEKASARLAEEVGDAAHPLSAEKTKAMRAAESAGEKRAWDRTARATDDMEAFGPDPKASAREARKAHIEAQRKLDELKAQHMDAQVELRDANKKVKAGEKAKKEALRADAKAARASQVGEKTGISDIGGALEILDIPGMPKPSDLPIVGPLLGAYLKFRTLKKAIGKKMGRVPATADAKAAVLASQTRDRVARAIDRSIGVAEKSAQWSVPRAPLIAGVLAARIFDDGEPAPKKGASVPELAAARMRELSAYVNTPNAIELDVRREMRHVTDPDLIAAVELARRNAFTYLASTMPPVPEPSLLNHVDYLPSPAEAMKFGRRLEAINDPAGVFERLTTERELLSLEAAEALRKVYPRMFGEAQARLIERASEGKLNVPMRQRVQLSLLYQVPLDASLDPDNLKITQSVYDRKPSSPSYNPQAPGVGAQGPTAQPSIANPVNLSQGLTPAIDRR